MSHLILTTVGTGGDVIPFARLGARLRRSGHEVTLISNSAYEKMALASGLCFDPLDSPEQSAELIEDGNFSNSPQGFLAMYRKHFLPRVRKECELIRKWFRPTESILISRSTPSIAALIAAETLQIPLVSVFLAPSFITSIPMFEELVECLLAEEINAIRAQLALPGVEDWNRWLRQRRTYIGLWPDWFAEPPGNWSQRVKLTGFVLPSDGESGSLPEEVEAILSVPGPVALLTGGTGNFSELKTIETGIEACRKAGLRGIVVTTGPEKWERNLGPDFVCVRQACFAKLMPRVEIVVHHGGIGTMAQALASGVPQLIVGVGADRPDNAAHAKRLGVAEYVPPAQQGVEEMSNHLQRLMAPEVRRQCQSIALRLRGEDGAANACAVIESSTLESSSTDSSEIDVRRQSAFPVQKRNVPANTELRERLQALSPAKRALMERRLWGGE